MHLNNHQATTQQTAPGVPIQEAHSQLLIKLFKEHTFQQIRKQLSTQPWYRQCSPAEQQCIDCFLNATKDNEHPSHRLARNHRRGDIGAWVLMQHLPIHPELQHILQQLQAAQPDLLNDTNDRTLLGKMLDIHTMIKLQDTQAYIDYIHSLPREDQSRTIQTYKQMIIGWMSHANGRSMYFPYLPAEKTIDTYDVESLHDPALQDRFPEYETHLQLLLDAPDHILPPRSDLQQLFHDIVLISSLAHQVQDVSVLQQVIDILATKPIGLIANSYKSNSFIVPHGTPQDNKEHVQKTTSISDNYLHHSYTTLTSMRLAVHELLQDRATLHMAFQEHGCYPSSHMTILKNIRQNLSSLSEAHGRVDLHYFMRHLPSVSDNKNYLTSKPSEGISQNNITIRENSAIFREKSFILLSSEWQYALMSTAIIMSYMHRKFNKNTNIYTYKGLNNSSKDMLQPIRKINETRLYYKTELIKLLLYINILPTTSIHITHSRVLKWIRDNYGFKNAPSAIDEHSSYLLPIYKGAYLEDGICCNPEVREETRKKISELVGQHMKTYNVQSIRGANKLSELSSTEFCYRITDYLRLVYQTNTAYDTLYTQLLTSCSSVQTLTLYFTDQHTIITSSMDAHTE